MIYYSKIDKRVLWCSCFSCLWSWCSCFGYLCSWCSCSVACVFGALVSVDCVLGALVSVACVLGALVSVACVLGALVSVAWRRYYEEEAYITPYLNRKVPEPSSTLVTTSPPPHLGILELLCLRRLGPLRCSRVRYTIIGDAGCAGWDGGGGVEQEKKYTLEI